jgi:predicted lipoprotein with Yx(FWY)xxD motif
MHKLRKAPLCALTAAGLTLLAACGSSGGSDSPAAAPPAATSSTSASGSSGSGSVLSAQSTGLGTILVDSRGRTVYVFANDKANVSNCDAACAANWPPVSAPTPLPASLPGVSGAIGMATRSDGSHQLSVAGHPVYTFTGDSAAGQTNGQGINLNGGVWTVVLPTGAPDTSPSGAGAQTTGPSY